jgi:hypothetical protein
MLQVIFFSPYSLSMQIHSTLDHEAIEDDPDTEMALDSSPPFAAVSATAFLPGLVQPLLALINPCPLSFPPLAGPSPYPPITSVLSSIHVCALECLNNIFLSLAASSNPAIAADKESGRKVWDDVWAALGVVGVVTGLGQERRRDVWEIAVGVLWGIGEVWKRFLVGIAVDQMIFDSYGAFRSHPVKSKSKF